MKKMTIVTNKYTLGLIVVALFAVMLYMGYIGLSPYNEALVNETMVVEAIADQENEQFGLLNEDYVSQGNLFDENVFFIEYRLDRDRTRGNQVELLRKIIDDPNSIAETRQEAEEKIIRITNYLGKELQLENLIKAKGFEETVVFIQPQSVTAVINQEEFTRDELIRITDLIITVTGQSIENIYIVPNRSEK